MFFNIKNMIFTPFSLYNFTQTLETPPPQPMTTGDRHEPSRLVAGPPHGEENFSQSKIFKTQLKDSIENGASNPPFAVSSR